MSFQPFNFQVACLIYVQVFQLPISHWFCDVFQAQGANGAKLRYTGMTDVLRKTVQADGFKGLYRVGPPSYQPLHPLITAVSALV